MRQELLLAEVCLHLDDDIVCLVQRAVPGHQSKGEVPEPVGDQQTKGEWQEGGGEEQGQLQVAQTVPHLVLQGRARVGEWTLGGRYNA